MAEGEDMVVSWTQCQVSCPQTEWEVQHPWHVTWPQPLHDVLLFLVSETGPVLLFLHHTTTPPPPPPRPPPPSPGQAAPEARIMCTLLISKWIISNKDSFPTGWKSLLLLNETKFGNIAQKLYLHPQLMIRQGEWYCYCMTVFLL